MKSSIGLCGATGKTPEIQIGQVKTVEHTQKASVEITGTRETPILNFNIPKGKDGAKLIIKEIFNGDIEILNNINATPTTSDIKSVISTKGIKEFKKQLETLLQSNLDETGLLKERVNNLTTIKEGSTTGDAEILDARLGYDRVLYNNVGDAIRGQVAYLNNKTSVIAQGIQKGVLNVKALYDWEDGYINTQGQLIPTDKMKRTTKPLHLGDMVLLIQMQGENYNLHVLTYDLQDNFIENIDYINKNEITINTNNKNKYAFCLQYRLDNNTVADLNTLNITSKSEVYSKIEDITQHIDNLNKVEIAEITQKRTDLKTRFAPNTADYLELITNDNLSYDCIIKRGSYPYGYFIYSLNNNYDFLKDKTMTIIIKNTGQNVIDLSKNGFKFCLSDGYDFNTKMFNIVGLTQNKIIKPNQQFELQVDFSNNDIKALYGNVTEQLNMFIGVSNNLNNVDLSFNIQVFILDSKDKRRGLVVADKIKGVDLNRFEKTKEIKIVCHGDSLTMGAGWEDHSPDNIQRGFPEFLQEFTQVPTINTGIGGDKLNDIFARIGSEPIVVNNVTIPSNKTPVNLGYPLKTILNRDVTTDISSLWNAPNKINPVIIKGVKGTLKQDTFKGDYYFIRNTEGEQVVINRPTIITTVEMQEYRDKDYIHIFYVGQNGGYDNVDDWIGQIKRAIEFIGCDKYLVIACQTNEHNDKWQNIYNKFAYEFKANFVDLRSYLVNYGLEDVGITPTEQDKTDILNGITPTSLHKRGDKVHFNYYGYKVIAKMLHNRLIELYPNIFI